MFGGAISGWLAAFVSPIPARRFCGIAYKFLRGATSENIGAGVACLMKLSGAAGLFQQSCVFSLVGVQLSVVFIARSSFLRRVLYRGV